jgi:hypothetical protein
VAITFGNHVFFSRSGWAAYKSVHDLNANPGDVEDGIAWAGHEVTHTFQARPIGTLMFVVKYLIQWIGVGFNYDDIPYEIEAEANEIDIRNDLKAGNLMLSIQNRTYPAPSSTNPTNGVLNSWGLTGMHYGVMNAWYNGQIMIEGTSMYPAWRR